MTHRKYLDTIGYSTGLEDIDPKDYLRWKEQESTYGFNDSETWNLDSTMLSLLYERLMMFKDVNNVDLKFHSVSYQGQELNLEQVLDRMCVLAQEALTCENNPYIIKLLDEEDDIFFSGEDEENTFEEMEVVQRSTNDSALFHWFYKRYLAVQNDASLAAQEVWELWSLSHKYFWWQE